MTMGMQALSGLGLVYIILIFCRCIYYFITFHNTNLLNKKKPVTKNAYVTADSSTRPGIVFANNYSILPS